MLGCLVGTLLTTLLHHLTFSYDTVDVGMKDIYAHPATARMAQLQAL